MTRLRARDPGVPGENVVDRGAWTAAALRACLIARSALDLRTRVIAEAAGGRAGG